ncbi:hypothetical protein JOD64_005317 [Micromonospora luteifusca]|uniref:Uncharacterized protein n=1 Tax=Micromonospora luteifusca TaxID=709860 RepID=A0ABS2M0V8_9ACTN|nr:hypothetical protein [Micromonospora luteifusca]MBM7494095.1 hypothetical protein [Micromonospora luteifusca]
MTSDESIVGGGRFDTGQILAHSAATCAHPIMPRQRRRPLAANAAS